MERLQVNLPTPNQAEASTGTTSDTNTIEKPAKPLFANAQEQQVAMLTANLMRQYETQSKLVPSSSALSSPEIQAKLVAQVQEKLRPVQVDLEGIEPQTPTIDIAAVVAKTTEFIISQTIDIPRISVTPSGAVTTRFDPFKLNLDGLHLQPGERELVLQNLHTNEQSSMMLEHEGREQRLEDYIVHALIDFDDIDYPTHAELIYDLAGQMVRHLQSYLSEQETHDVLDRSRSLIANAIHAQMMQHFKVEASHYEVKINRGFTELKPCNYTASASQPTRHYRETVTELGRIKQMLFSGFERCLYPVQKFDSDTERRFAIILERDAIKWLKPAKGQFQIFYKLGNEQPEYIPDFVAETDSQILMIETKARSDIETDEVREKAKAALQWCQHASAYAKEIGNKTWRYLLIPHDEVLEMRRINDYLRFEFQAK